MRFGKAGEPIHPGSQVRIWGGYELEPTWLPESGGNTGVKGTVTSFITDKGDPMEKAVVKLDVIHHVGSALGQIVVLSLVDRESDWLGGERVTVELCDFDPRPKRFRKRQKGQIVERAAICELL